MGGSGKVDGKNWSAGARCVPVPEIERGKFAYLYRVMGCSGPIECFQIYKFVLHSVKEAYHAFLLRSLYICYRTNWEVGATFVATSANEVMTGAICLRAGRLAAALVRRLLSGASVRGLSGISIKIPEFHS